MKLIGITGGVGCGKTSATLYLQEKGHSVVDADLIVKQLFERTEVQKQILDRMHTLDKRELRNLIFTSADQRKILETILHPRVMVEIQNQILSKKRGGADLLFVSIPLLFEKKLEVMFDEVWVISCTEENQIQRILQRDEVNTQMSIDMIKSQMTLSEKISKAHRVIANDATLDEFHQKIDLAIQSLH